MGSVGKYGRGAVRSSKKLDRPLNTADMITYLQILKEAATLPSASVRFSTKRLEIDAAVDSTLRFELVGPNTAVVQSQL